MPPQMGSVVDIQAVQVSQFQIVRLPAATAGDLELAGLAARLTALSAEGYGIAVHTPSYLVMAKAVGLIKLSMDVGRVVLPFTAPAPGQRPS